MDEFKIVVTGHVLPGFTRKDTVEALARLIKQPSATAERLLAGQSVTVKRGIDAITADRYANALRNIGVACGIESDALDLQPELSTATPSTLTTTDAPRPSAPLPSVVPAQANDGVRLWNPNAAANWSVLFTPLFGATLIRNNWRTLGEPGRAGTTTVWMGMSLAWLAAAIFLPSEITVAIAFWFLVAWYLFNARPHAKFVQARFGKEYEHRSWLAPLGFAVLGIVVYAAYAMVVGLALPNPPMGPH